MGEWLRRIAGVLCVMTIMLQLIPEGSFSGYVRFYASLLYLLVVAGPLLQLFSREDVLERFLKLEFLKEAHFDLETAVEGLQDLKNETFARAWKQELVRQLGEVVAAYGGRMEDAEVRTGEDSTLQEVKIRIRTQEGMADTVAAHVRNEIAGIYTLDPERIQITEVEGG